MWRHVITILYNSGRKLSRIPKPRNEIAIAYNSYSNYDKITPKLALESCTIVNRNEDGASQKEAITQKK